MREPSVQTMTPDIRIQLQGMHCAACAARAEKALNAIDGVSEATVSATDHTAAIRLNGATADALEAALETAGYPPRRETVVLSIDGMTCAGCAGRVEKSLAALPGVTEATVNFAGRSAQVTGLAGAVDAARVIGAVRAAGYEASLPEEQDHGHDPVAQEVADAGRQTVIAAAMTLPVFVLEMGGHLYPPFHHWIAHTIGQDLSWMVQFVLTTLVLAGPGAVFVRRGLPDLLRGRPDMNSLVAMGSLAAWSFSTVALFWPSLLPPESRAVYFEAAAVIVTLILLGRWMEARARGQAGAAIRELAGLQPLTALVERVSGAQECSIAEISVGEIVHLRPGERVAVDGVVTSGQSRIDESMITGEPGTVQRSTGDWVTAGTVNGNGVLRYEARRVGAETVLARIIAMVQQAQGGKLPIQSLADRVVARFVPAVLAIALLTVTLWLVFGPEPALSHALVAGVSVLIIACPCAMGLATPTSIMAGTGRAAQLGVLFRKGEALQRLDSAAVVAFDKTGTLTEGKPRMSELTTVPGWDQARVLRLIGAAEAVSEHPVARALTAAAQERCGQLPQAHNVTAQEGLGLSAQVDGRDILIGSPRLMDQNSVDRSGLAAQISAIESTGQSCVLAAVDGDLCAAMAVADTLKPDAASTLQALHNRGLKTVMITGDSRQAAKAIGAKLGLSQVEAEILPAGKKEAIESLQAAHGPVVFVGDGINDAPALAAADVGIAMGTGTDVAIESAEVVLSSGRLTGVVTALDLSARTMRNIRQNLFWAFGYNIVLIPVAAGILYPISGTLLSPMLAAGAMALSSVFVVTNALRLRGFNPAPLTPAGDATKARIDPVAAE